MGDSKPPPKNDDDERRRRQVALASRFSTSPPRELVSEAKLRAALRGVSTGKIIAADAARGAADAPPSDTPTHLSDPAARPAPAPSRPAARIPSAPASASPSRRPSSGISRAPSAAPYVPFYARIPKAVARVVAIVAVAIAVIVAAASFLHRSLTADERATRDALSVYAFDHDEKHFEAIDRMGPKAVEFAVQWTADARSIETSFGRSSTKLQEVALLYLVHYASRIGVAPPAVAAEAAARGPYRLSAAAWPVVHAAWVDWWRDVQAKGKARLAG